MTVLASPIADGSSSTNAVFSFVGVLIGAVIAAAISYWVAKRARESAEEVAKQARMSTEEVAKQAIESAERVAERAVESTKEVAKQAREAAEREWIRDSRREIYDRFLTRAQRLLIVCEEAQESETKEAKASVETAFTEFFEVYGVVQTVADKASVDASRRYGYRLWELKESLDSMGVMGPENFDTVTPLIRDARQDTIDAMRVELGLTPSVRFKGKYNPFVDTPLEKKYAESPRPRPGAKAVGLPVFIQWSE
jgi:gas vesicle protein